MNNTPLNKPTWLLNKKWEINLDDSPLSSFKTNLQGFFSEENKNFFNDSIAKRRSAFDKADMYYDQIKNEKNQIINQFKNQVSVFSNDLLATDAKYFIASPFRGNLNTARFKAMEYLTGKYPDYPQITNDGYSSSITIIASANEYVNALNTLAAWLTIYLGKTDPSIEKFSEIFKTPLLSPLAGILSNNNSFQNSLDNINDLSENFYQNAAKQLPTDLLDQFKDAYKNSNLSKIVKAVEDIKDYSPSEIQIKLDETLNSKTSVINDLDVKSGEIQKDYIYQVINYDTIIYDTKEYTNGQFFKGTEETNYITLGKGKVVVTRGPDSIEDLGGNALDSIEALRNLKPFNRWFTIASFADIFKGVSDIAKNANQLYNTVSGAADEIVNAIDKGTEIIDNIYSAEESDFLGMYNYLKNVINSIDTDFNALTFNVFAVPPTQGGLNQIRFAHNEWFKDTVSGSPDIDDNSVVMMLTFVFSGTDLSLNQINKIAKMFNINFSR